MNNKLKKLNMLFFREDELTTSDIMAYTVGATLLIVMLYLKLN